MSKLGITGITVSVDISDKQYGNGSQSFLNLQGRYPDPSTLEEAMIDGLAMYFAAWESLLASRFATGVLTAGELKKSVEDAKVRVAKVRAFLQKQMEAPDEQ
jgi:hypothetical protein